MDVKGKTAIVTGASRGIGKQIAVELGRRGANVVVAARTVEAHRRLTGTIGETVAAVEEAGGQALAVRTDLKNLADIQALADAAVGRFGGIDVLVNNAADTSAGSNSILDLARRRLATAVRYQPARTLLADPSRATCDAAGRCGCHRQHDLGRG